MVTASRSFGINTVAELDISKRADDIALGLWVGKIFQMVNIISGERKVRSKFLIKKVCVELPAAPVQIKKSKPTVIGFLDLMVKMTMQLFVLEKKLVDPVTERIIKLEKKTA